MPAFRSLAVAIGWTTRFTDTAPALPSAAKAINLKRKVPMASRP
jgi:hypothetical protein